MKNNIIIIITVILIGLIGFWYMTKTDSSTSYLTSDVKTTDSVDAKYIYTILQKMDQVTLDDSIFLSPAFQNLKDNTVSFSPQTAGRSNPFAPVGADLGTASQGSVSAPAIVR